MTDKLSIKGVARAKLGTSASQKMRKDNMVPAVIYGGEHENEFVALPKKEIDKLYSTGHLFTTILEIQLGEKAEKVLPHVVDIHPLYQTPRHMDLIRIEPGKQIKAKILFSFSGSDRSPGIKRGGYLNIIYRRLELLCDPEKIPHSIDVDVSNIVIGSKIKVSDIKLPDGVQSHHKQDLIIASLTGRGGKKDEAEEGAESSTTTEAPKAENGGKK